MALGKQAEVISVAQERAILHQHNTLHNIGIIT